MTKNNSTKKALVFALLSTLLCVSMLVGTTFAWFTDTASTAVNKIVAGNLKVELVKEDGSKLTEALKWVSAGEGAVILWEPGCTYNLEGFRVKNSGTLAFKYKVVISGVDGDAKLLEALTFTYKVGEETFTSDEEFKLAAGETSETFAISAHMDETVGNEYRGLDLDGITITVYATQDTVESDGNGSDYDADATYPVLNADELKNALANGGIFNVIADIATNNPEDSVSARTTITAATTLNLDKKIISPDNMGNNDNNFAALYVGADTTINAGEDGGIDTGTNGGYGINLINGATLTINGGYYYGGGTAVQVQKGTLIINGGTFACEPYSNPVYGYKFLINCVDAAYKDGSAKIIITGGTFINFDPSDSASENPHGNFVADGYKVVSEEQANGDIWYTVVAE